MDSHDLHFEAQFDELLPDSKDDEFCNLRSQNDALLMEIESLRFSYGDLGSRFTAAVYDLVFLQLQHDQLSVQNDELIKTVEHVSSERDSFREEIWRIQLCLKEKEDEFERMIKDVEEERENLKNEVRLGKIRVQELLDEKIEQITVFDQSMGFVSSVKDSLARMIGSVTEEKVERENEKLGLEGEMKEILRESDEISRLASELEVKLGDYVEMRKKEKRELENSVVSLTEENRDINSLLRIALVEKEAVEKTLNKLKGNSEQKRVAILQIAERGLQRVGFGFMMGTGTNEAVQDTASNASAKSDGSECEEEVVSLASTVERIMKNLRLEITQLRRSLDESRSDTERLQSLTEKQSQKIVENTLYIKELEDRETMLAQNVEELLKEIKETEEEVSRWREACELEVDAGKKVIEERDKVAAILKEELEKTKAALDISNSKLKLKEELAAAAMAAQQAAERSLHLADSRAAELQNRIEELTRQLEEADSRARGNRHRVRHVCWPWRILKVNLADRNGSTRVRNDKRMLPEMQALLHSSA
ncbi:hypothetical protein RJ641_007553 [Dillenia turbinata]|uniref:Uncharacterized protein n=1 Tax=Dillenia turbinata TaxID=194707 RepID=A0AAN8V6I0_9MAGN